MISSEGDRLNDALVAAGGANSCDGMDGMVVDPVASLGGQFTPSAILVPCALVLLLVTTAVITWVRPIARGALVIAEAVFVFGCLISGCLHPRSMIAVVLLAVMLSVPPPSRGVLLLLGRARAELDPAA
jgi:hypothetical protein